MRLSWAFGATVKYTRFCSTQTLAVRRAKVIIFVREHGGTFPNEREPHVECQKRANTARCYRLFNGRPDHTHYSVALQLKFAEELRLTVAFSVFRNKRGRMIFVSSFSATIRVLRAVSFFSLSR